MQCLVRYGVRDTIHNAWRGMVYRSPYTLAIGTGNPWVAQVIPVPLPVKTPTLSHGYGLSHMAGMGLCRSVGWSMG